MVSKNIQHRWTVSCRFNCLSHVYRLSSCPYFEFHVGLLLWNVHTGCCAALYRLALLSAVNAALGYMTDACNLQMILLPVSKSVSETSRNDRLLRCIILL